MKEIARRLYEALEASGLSYGDLSNQTGIAKSSLQRYFTGETAKIPINRLEVIARALGTTTEAIMGWDTPAEKPNGDLMALREQLRRQPGLRVLFDASKGATEQIFLSYFSIGFGCCVI